MSISTESSSTLANGSSSNNNPSQSQVLSGSHHSSSLSTSISELQSPSSSMILSSSSSNGNKIKSLYSQSAKSFLQRDHLKAISSNQSALNLLIQSSSTDHDQLNKLLILRLTILSTIYSSQTIKSDLISSLTKSSSSNSIHRELLTIFNLNQSLFIQSFWKECLTLSNGSHIDSISIDALRPNPSTLNLALSLNHSVLSSAILAAIKLDDSSRESHNKLNSDQVGSSSRLISEWFLAAFASINLSEIREQKIGNGNGNGNGLDYENLKLSYEKVIEVYSLHILGVRSGEWEYASEIVAYSQLDQAQNQVSRNDGEEVNLRLRLSLVVEYHCFDSISSISGILIFFNSHSQRFEQGRARSCIPRLCLDAQPCNNLCSLSLPISFKFSPLPALQPFPLSHATFPKALLSKLATAKSELESRPERERKASLSAMKSYQEEKSKRDELLEKQLQESLKKKESLNEASQKTKGDGLLNGVGQFLKSGKKSSESSTASSSTRSQSSVNGSTINGKARRSSTSSENSSTSSISNTNSSPEKKGKRNDHSGSGSGSGSGSDGSSPTRRNRDGKSQSLAKGEKAKSKGKEKEGANSVSKASADEDSNSFSNERERLSDFIKKGNDKNSKPTLSKETTNPSKSSETSSNSSLVKSQPSSSSSLNKKPTTNSSSNSHQTLIQNILSLRLLGLNLSTYWGYRISTMFGVLITLLFVWKRSTTSNGGAGTRVGNESNVGRKVRQNLSGNQSVEGGLVGNAVRRIWDTLRM